MIYNSISLAPGRPYINQRRISWTGRGEAEVNMEQLLRDVSALNASVSKFPATDVISLQVAFSAESIKISIDESRKNIELQLDTQQRLNHVTTILYNLTIYMYCAPFSHPFVFNRQSPL